MDILQKISYYASEDPGRPVFRNGEQILTYGELEVFSDRLADFLVSRTGEKRPEIIVYGHKHPFMLVSFISCIKAGLAYCPVDISMPKERIRDILLTTGSPLILATEDFPLPAEDRILPLSEMSEIVQESGRVCDPARRLGNDDICYIIFTSGSTGKPKGVQIPYGCLCRFTAWGVTLGTSPAEKTGKRFLNQAPFSFDLSVMDLYLCLASGGTLCVLDKSIQDQYRLLFDRLKEYQPQVWVSTPSFVEVCLADPDFAERTLPEIEVFLFCGERLTNRTAEKLKTRFPGARVMNTYGPTESTVAVTEVEVTPELLSSEDPLPVGRAKPGTRILILSEDGRLLPDGEAGEIVITGDTLAAGYYHAEELTSKAFRPVAVPPDDGSQAKIPGTHEETAFQTSGPDSSCRVIGYHTGDEGYLRDGMLFYNGRIDLQIKLHGYRIELSDIENNLLKVPGVEQACVVPSERDGRITKLHAFVVMPERQEDNDRKQGAVLKEQLASFLPEYMVPGKFHFITQIPMTMNGKADRKKLKEMLG